MGSFLVLHSSFSLYGRRGTWVSPSIILNIIRSLQTGNFLLLGCTLAAPISGCKTFVRRYNRCRGRFEFLHWTARWSRIGSSGVARRWILSWFDGLSLLRSNAFGRKSGRLFLFARSDGLWLGINGLQLSTRR